MSDAREVALRADEAMELAELLEFIDDWLAGAPAPVAESLCRFGSHAYGVADLRADLASFAFLVGGSPERFFEGRP